MNDNASSDKKVKPTPTVYYAEKAKTEKPKRFKDKSEFSKFKSEPRSDRRKDGKNASDSRIETFKPRSKPSNQDTSSSSPWKSRVKSTQQYPSFDNDTNDYNIKPTVDSSQIRRQRKEETLIYSENSCKAVFENRPKSIVKAFFIQETTYQFKALIAWLVENRLGYDVISAEQMTKIAQTPHHGGVCLIVKKRKPVSVSDYLFNKRSSNDDSKTDCVLAIDDINNPHNLGGIARTASFFNVNGLLLRQPDLLDNGAALRVSEGGAESITPIKADDFIVALDQFKNNGYEIVALLPCKVNSLKADELAKMKPKAKTVFIIFQQINTKLPELADKVVFMQGSESMAALNISVLTGILLEKWQQNIQ